MGDTLGSVQHAPSALQQQPRPGTTTSPPPALRPVSAESFLQGTTIAWDHLQPAERKAIRACCRAGRLQHDRMLAELRLSLGGSVRRGPRQPPPMPLPSYMRTTLQAAVGRGARPHALKLSFGNSCSDEGREARLLAALEACSGCPLSRLELAGAVPLSGAVAEAVEACCPQLLDLRLQHSVGLGHGGPDVEAHVFGGIAQLRSLRSLSLTAHLDPDDCTPDTLRPHATCVAHLSALSALTSLKLELSDCYEHDGHSYNKQQKDGEQHGAWVEVREAHRTSLLSALRCMPQLQHLDCPTLWLRSSELPACLTALTSLTLGGLLPPPAGEGTVHAAGGSARPLAEGGALPPQLRDLVLKDSASPRALASLRLPPSFTRLEVTMLRFGTTDVTPDMRLRPEAVAAVGPAVRMAVAHRDAACGPKAVCFLGDGGDGTVLPREDSPNGHSEWIRQLRGLDVFRTLVLQGWGFVSTGDMCCLAEALPGLQELYIWVCFFSLSSVPGLRPHMTQLYFLELDLTHCEDACDAVLQSVALLLLRPHPGAVQLEELVYRECPDEVDMEACDEVIMERLERDFGVTDVSLVFMDWGD